MAEKSKRASREKREKTATTSQIGSRIKALRINSERSQAQVAEAAGISSKYLGEVERGEANISIELIAQIAQALGLPLSAVMESEHERPHQELIDEIMRMVPNLSYKDARIAYRMLKALTE